jgi:ABC-type antimicrobial peptide transport system permease subunit
MLKKLNNILNIIMGSTVGVTIGHSIYQYINYKKYPDLYAMQSAPWYTSILLYGSVTIIVLLISIIIKIIIKRKLANK